LPAPCTWLLPIICWFCPLFGNNPNGLLIKWFLSTVTLVTQLGIIYLIMMRFNRPDYTFAFTNLLKNKLKSLKVAKWKKDDEGWWRMMKDDEGWWNMMKDDEWWLISSWFGVSLSDRRTDICDCRVAFATENLTMIYILALPSFILVITWEIT